MSIGKKRAPRFHVGDPVSFLYGTENVAGEIWSTEAPWGTMDVASTEFASTRDRKTSRHSRFRKKILRVVIRTRTPFKLLDFVRNSDHLHSEAEDEQVDGNDKARSVVFRRQSESCRRLHDWKMGRRARGRRESCNRYGTRRM